MFDLDPVALSLLILLGLAFVLKMTFHQKYERGKILQVLDGDSLIIATEKYRRGVKVRLAGIDAPEKSHSIFQRDEKFARQSARYVEDRLPPSTPIYLEYDRQKWDQYGRLLAYVYLEKSGKSINEEMIRKGYAIYRSHPRNKKYDKVFRRLEAQARRYRHGLWEHE